MQSLHGVVWGGKSTHPHTPRTRNPHQQSQINIYLVRAVGHRRGGKRDTKGEQAVFKGCFQPAGQSVCVFLYKVFPITVALSVSGSISSEFLCSSCQTYGINQGFGAGALAAGMLTAWQTRGSGVMESPSLWPEPGRRMRGGGER